MLIFPSVCRYLAPAALLLAMGNVIAVPDINTVSPVVTPPVQNTQITIGGSNFGAKSQAAPILFDRVSETFENGVVNPRQGDFNEGDIIQTVANDPDTIWIKPSGPGTPAMITFSSPHRHERIDAHYLVNGGVGFVGYPAAYNNIGTNNTRLYVSWWYKPGFHPAYYWVWDLSNISGQFQSGNNFEPGEPLLFEKGSQVVAGEVVTFADSRMHFIAIGQINTNFLSGATVRGVESGATATVSTNGMVESPGSSKFVRIWEEESGNPPNLRLSWTQAQTTMVGRSSTNVTASALRVRDWNHMELELDLANNRYRSWINNILQYDLDISAANRNTSNFSPTIALLGIDGKQGFQKSEFGEIYMDNTLQRVVIGNAPTIDAVTHTEVQFPSTWNDSTIVFNLDLGAFTTGDNSNLYVYVYDEVGDVNFDGVPICPSCTAPTGAPQNLQ